MHTMPTVQDYMSREVRFVAPEETLARAQALMRELRIRHLPVLDGTRLIGVLSQRDVYLMETLKGVVPGEVPVSDAMRGEPWCVGPDATLEDVALAMWRDKKGAALVVEGERLVGIFTRTDALRALTELLAGERTVPATASEWAPPTPA